MPITRTCGPRICHVSDVRAEDIPLIEHPGFAEHRYSSLVRREGMFRANCQLFWSPEAMKRYSIWSVDFTKEDCVKGLKNCGLLWVHDKSDHFFPLFTPKPMAQGGSSPGNVVWTHGNSYSTYDHFRRLLQFMDEAGLAYDPPLPKPLNSAQLPDLSGLYEVVGVATPTPGRITGLPNNDLVKTQTANAVPNSANSTFYNIYSGGVRGETTLSTAQRAQVDSYLTNFDLKNVDVRFVDDTQLSTGYGNMFGQEVLNIGSDVVPGNVGLGTLTANSRVSIKGTLAHEIVGHREAALAGRTQDNLFLEEAQASIRAARFAPDLNSTERFSLLRDAITRLQNVPEGPVKVRDVKDSLYIQSR